MKDLQIELLISMFQSGELCFFAGSGISYDSNLPSAFAVLKHTSDVFLSEEVPEQEKEKICSSIQPEVFYETLISLTNTIECLHLWRALYRPMQDAFQVDCTPNLVHYFIVKYSFENKVPIFTTNFDTMFEESATAMGIDFEVLLPDDSYERVNDESLFICKLHGSVENASGDYSPQNLWTTMTGITKINVPWLRCVERLMKQKRLTFVGYSGRDIDYFPYICKLSREKDVRKVIWINRFYQDYSDVASVECGAVKINMWPSELFSSIVQNMGYELGHRIPLRDPEKMECFLSGLAQDLKAKHLLSEDERLLLLCVLLGKLGRYDDAYRLICTLNFDSLKFHHPSNRYLLLLSLSRLSHEKSRYLSCERFAKQILKNLKNEGSRYLSIEIQARCLVSEARRMGIPSDVYFSSGWRFRRYFQAGIVALHFWITSMICKYQLWRFNLSFEKLEVAAQHEWVEHRIRFYALLQSSLGSVERGWNRLVKRMLLERWANIREKSYRIGYSAGIANVGKFRYRLLPHDETKNEALNIYGLITSSTGKELLRRNEAEKCLREGQFDLARQHFSEYSELARKSGNTLNEIKGLIGSAYCHFTEHQSVSLDPHLVNRLDALVPQVEGALWQKYLTSLVRFLRDRSISP